MMRKSWGWSRELEKELCGERGAQGERAGGPRMGALTGGSEEPGPLRPHPVGSLPTGQGHGRSRSYWPPVSPEWASLSEPQVLTKQMGK